MRVICFYRSNGSDMLISRISKPIILRDIYIYIYIYYTAVSKECDSSVTAGAVYIALGHALCTSTRHSFVARFVSDRLLASPSFLLLSG